MEGAGRAADRRVDLALFQAWHGEAFAREKRLKSLSKYRAQTGPQKGQSPAQLLGALREFKARGAKMEIRRVPND